MRGGGTNAGKAKAEKEVEGSECRHSQGQGRGQPQRGLNTAHQMGDQVIQLMQEGQASFETDMFRGVVKSSRYRLVFLLFLASMPQFEWINGNKDNGREASAWGENGGGVPCEAAAGGCTMELLPKGEVFWVIRGK